MSKCLRLAVAVQQLGVADGVAPLDAVVVLAVQEHVHLGQRPGAADGLLPVQRVLARAGALADQPAALHQQRAGAAGGVADLVAGLRVHQPRHQRGHLGRRVELAGLLAAGGGEVLDQELVGVADHVELADAALAQVELGLGEVFQQVAQDVVLLLLVAQLVAVEADVLEDIAQLAEVGLFDGVQRLVDALAVARRRGAARAARRSWRRRAARSARS